jgi:hypothetical protein
MAVYTVQFTPSGEPHRKMDGQNRAGARRNRFPHGRYAEAVGIVIDVRENRDAADEKHRGRRAIPGIGRHNDLVTKTDASRLKCGDQSNRAV